MFEEYLSDWDFIISLLPKGWEKQVRELKMMKFGRKFSGKNKEADLLRVLMMHLADGLSLRATAAAANVAGISGISDVAILARLRKSTAWFQWATNSLIDQHFSAREKMPELDFRVVAVDASVIKEQGLTGTQWYLHYSINLTSLSPEEFILSTRREKGESFCNFKVKAGDLFVGDRVYATGRGISYIINSGGQVLCRFSPSKLGLFSSEKDIPFQLLNKLRKLEFGQSASWNVRLKHDNVFYHGRVCAVKKPRNVANEAKRNLIREAKANGRKMQENTLEFAEYTLIFTTLTEEKYTTEFILRLYRLRWQVELFFKRLKSLLMIGHLPKYDEECSRAYLSGKIFIAILLELIAYTGDDFFPCGGLQVSRTEYMA